MNINIPKHIQGLTDNEVEASLHQFGKNQIDNNENESWLKTLFEILKEPMLLLLISVSIIYVILGEYHEAIFMLFSIVVVSAISFYQDTRSKNALKALVKLNDPLSNVIRNGKAIEIYTSEIVVGDCYIVEEGKMINADGKILYSSDFSVNESALTGESFSIFKETQSDDNNVYSGTMVVSGLAIVQVTHIGNETRIGKIGKSLQEIQQEESPLQMQIKKFVKAMALIGVIVFCLICLYQYYLSKNILESLLNGLTLAMSILPEEIPVAFTTFMALGAWKLMREGIIIKQSTVIETLGSTTVICTDKTGTITQNAMNLISLYDYHTKQTYQKETFFQPCLNKLISYAMWSSEPIPFDPMEKSIHQVYSETQKTDLRNQFNLIYEYPLSGTPPMMTHIFENENKERLIAAKGAPEAILQASKLPDNERKIIEKKLIEFAEQGYRVLGVAQSNYIGDNFPTAQQSLPFEFLGLLIFYDPPKVGIQNVFQQIDQAGIQVKIITGDNAETAQAIAKQAGIRNGIVAINGNELQGLSDVEISHKIKNANLFSRMYPEAKLKIINTLKAEGEIVAMIGDGVNDGPALKAAHIGVAMGNKGTEIAKAAAALIITNDDLKKLIVAITTGRRIYTNIKKAIQYIISIHIPIILTVSLPLFLGWIYPQIFTPIHVIFLELVMGPTCSIVYENEPIEKNAMSQAPRKMTETFLNWKELLMSIVQGLLIAAGVLFVYQWAVTHNANEETTRALVFSTLLFANIFLSFVNRSFYYSIIETLQYKNKLLFAITTVILIMLFAILYIEPIAQFFHLVALQPLQLLFAFLIAAISVLWFEVYKLINRFLV